MAYAHRRRLCRHSGLKTQSKQKWLPLFAFRSESSIDAMQANNSWEDNASRITYNQRELERFLLAEEPVASTIHLFQRRRK